MQKDDFQILRFRVFPNRHGSVQSVGGGRRNGKPAVFFPRSLAEPPDQAAEQPALCEQPRLFVNLNALERETWRKIDRKSTRLNSSHLGISYAVFCLKKKQ